MTLRSSMSHPSTVTKTLVCIDNTDNFEFSGKIFNPYMPRIHEFHGIMEMISIMDGFFNEINFPQSTYSERTFTRKKEENIVRREPFGARDIPKHFDDKYFNAYIGKCATFILQVKFRKNATWQGSVEWLEAKQTNTFRSTLELIKLIIYAVQNKEGQPVEDGWNI